MSYHRNRRSQRGQAMVETALGSIVFVTIVIFLLHFAEVGYLSMKVTEAAHSALFDATGRRMHRWPGDASPADMAASMAGQEAHERYTDFDSLSVSMGAPLTKVFTAAQPMTVQCGKAGSGVPRHKPNMLNGGYKENGGIECRAEATLTAINIPTSFLDDGEGSFFTEKHYEPKPIRLCAIGRYQGGCGGKLHMMLDDWGLAGAEEGQNCFIKPNMPNCANKAFYGLAKAPFQKSGAGMGVFGYLFAFNFVGVPPPILPQGEMTFWLSSVGEDTFVQPLAAEGNPVWATSTVLPGGFGGLPYTFAWLGRRKCFLGHTCG